MKIDSMLIVIMLYKTKLSDSMTYKSIISFNKTTCKSFNILVYDNSPYFKEYISDVYNAITFIRDKSNTVIANAYNKGVEFASKFNFNWIMLLDQDTELNELNFTDINYIRNFVGQNVSVVSIIPKIVTPEEFMISSVLLKRGGLIRYLSQVEPGIQNFRVSALNSGAIINGLFLIKIGGFNEKYPLDILYHWLFREIYKNKCHIYLMDVSITHNFSIMNFEDNLIRERHKILLAGEILFAKETLLDFLVYKCRLIFRLSTQVKMRNKYYFWKTLDFKFLNIITLFMLFALCLYVNI
jgi:hypothetical protein